MFLRTEPSIIPVILLHTTADASLSIAELGWPQATTDSTFWFAYFVIVLVIGAVLALVLRRSPDWTQTREAAA